MRELIRAFALLLVLLPSIGIVSMAVGEAQILDTEVWAKRVKYLILVLAVIVLSQIGVAILFNL